MDEKIKYLYEMDRLFQEEINKKMKIIILVVLGLLLILAISFSLSHKYSTCTITEIPEHDIVIIAVTHPELRSQKAINNILADAITEVQKSYEILDSDYGNYSPPEKTRGMILVVRPKI